MEISQISSHTKTSSSTATGSKTWLKVSLFSIALILSFAAIAAYFMHLNSMITYATLGGSAISFILGVATAIIFRNKVSSQKNLQFLKKTREEAFKKRLTDSKENDGFEIQLNDPEYRKHLNFFHSDFYTKLNDRRHYLRTLAKDPAFLKNFIEGLEKMANAIEEIVLNDESDFMIKKLKISKEYEKYFSSEEILIGERFTSHSKIFFNETKKILSANNLMELKSFISLSITWIVPQVPFICLPGGALAVTYPKKFLSDNWLSESS